MSRANTWLNDDGLNVPFGSSDGIKYTAAGIHTKGLVKELIVDIDFATLPGYTVPQGDDVQLPAGASIVSAKYYSDIVFSHAVEFGTKIAAGTVSDKNGLITTAVMTADTVVVGTGAQVNTKIATDLYITCVETTTPPTTGAGRLIVEYTLQQTFKWGWGFPSNFFIKQILRGQ